MKRACSISETKSLFVIKGHTYFDAAKAGCSFAIQYTLFHVLGMDEVSRVGTEAMK